MRVLSYMWTSTHIQWVFGRGWFKQLGKYLTNMPECAKISNSSSNLHNKLQKSTLEVKNQMLTACLWSNWMSPGSLTLHFFSQSCHECMCSCKISLDHFQGYFSVVAPEELRVQNSAQMHRKYCKLLILNFDMKTEILTKCICLTQREVDHSRNSSDFKLYWAEAQYPACTVE